MKYVSGIFPYEFRQTLRRRFDSLSSKPMPGKETIGHLSQWTIVTSGLNPASVIYSGGVGEDITFEEELIRRFDVDIQIFDPSPVAARTIARAASDHLHFSPIGLSASAVGNFAIGGGSDDSTWFKAGSGDVVACTTIAEQMKKNRHSHIDLLKIDIEGFEYEVLESCFAAEIPITQICVEFHDFFPEISRKKTKDMIELLKARGFDLIHRHRHDHTFLRS